MAETNMDTPGGCEACALGGSRREFLQHAKLVALGALLGMGVPTGRALAMRPIVTKARALLGNNPTYPIPAEDGVQIDGENDVVLVRLKDKIYALSLSCPHQGTTLDWNKDDDQFTCPKHDS